MRTPSIKAIQTNFPYINNPKLIKLLLTSDEVVTDYINHYNLTKQFYNQPGPRYARLLALNHALDMFGVEHVGQYDERGFYFLNTGDTYAATLIQFDDKESIFISSWGDVVEKGKYK